MIGGGDRSRTCEAVKEPRRTYGRARDLNLLVVRRRAGRFVTALALGAPPMLQPHYCCELFRLLLSALLVIHLRTVTRCRRPPAPELAAREFRSHDLSLARDCSLLPYCSPLLGIAAAHGSWHGGTIMLAHRLTCRVQSSAVSCGKTKISRNSAVALTGFLWSAGWNCTNALRDSARHSSV